MNTSWWEPGALNEERVTDCIAKRIWGLEELRLAEGCNNLRSSVHTMSVIHTAFVTVWNVKIWKLLLIVWGFWLLMFLFKWCSVMTKMILPSSPSSFIRGCDWHNLRPSGTVSIVYGPPFNTLTVPMFITRMCHSFVQISCAARYQLVSGCTGYLGFCIRSGCTGYLGLCIRSNSPRQPYSNGPFSRDLQAISGPSSHWTANMHRHAFLLHYRKWPTYAMWYKPFLARLVFANEKACLLSSHLLSFHLPSGFQFKLGG